MKSLILIFVFCISGLSLSAQILISINQTISKDTVIATIQRNVVLNAKTVNASGRAEFSSNSGYVRILLSDDYGYDLLVYESSPLVVTNGIDNFNNVSMEAIDISANLALTKVRVEIKNAELKNLLVDISATNPSRTQQQQARTDRIALMNSNLRSQNALWVAGETEVSQMSHQEKKGLFGDKIPDLQGFEYYIGGVFELHSDSLVFTQTTTRSSYVSSFDWRNRHGANNPSSPYYNSGGHGWITSVKNQNSCGSCAIFSVIGTIEALTNLYYNQFLNKDLSEQHIVSCFDYPGSCATGAGWNPRLTIDYITANGVSEESCFRYTATDQPCANKCSNPTENIKVSGRINCGTTAFPKTIDAIKHNIIKYGPISGGVTSLSHAMSIVGYKEIQEGDDIYLGSMYSHITIPPNDSRIGQTAWLFKNSWGTSWGNKGFCYMLLSNVSDIGWTHVILTPVTSPNLTNANIKCEDKDGDGYYYWGIGPKPATCPSWAPDEPDGDDSNPTLGPMDEYGNCIQLPQCISNFTNQSVTTNTTITGCSTLHVEDVIVKTGAKLTIISGGEVTFSNFEVESGGEYEIVNN